MSNYLNINMQSITSLILLIGWLMGIVLAKGFWSTFFSIIFPIWAYYLVIEHFMNIYL